MSRTTKLKKCSRCGELKSTDLFVDVSGTRNPKGGYCTDCHLIRMEEWEHEAKKDKESKLRKLKIIYGEWWKHYCLPQEFSDDIYSERDYCPYCGNKLPPRYTGNLPTLDPFRGRAHLDHMDPLLLGGEDSIRNVVYICYECNYKKGKRSFVDWLKMLNPKQRQISRDIYEAKHGHPPESFEPGWPNERCYGTASELDFDEEELRRMYPTPIVDGPPVNEALCIRLDDKGKIVAKLEKKQ